MNVYMSKAFAMFPVNKKLLQQYKSVWDSHFFFKLSCCCLRQKQREDSENFCYALSLFLGFPRYAYKLF